MSSFTNTTNGLLIAGALVLGGGIFYQSYATQRLDEARQALQQVEAAQSRAEATRERGRQYVNLIADMAGKKIDRQEPLSVVSEFSPREISQVTPLLDTLYQRDGHFFLESFQLAWRGGNAREGLLPRVALDIEGRKVLLFSEAVAGSSTTSNEQR